MKNSQKDKVLKKLVEQSFITVEDAEKMGIARLAVMIERLRKDGYEINTIYGWGNKKGRYEIRK